MTREQLWRLLQALGTASAPLPGLLRTWWRELAIGLLTVTSGSLLYLQLRPKPPVQPEVVTKTEYVTQEKVVTEVKEVVKWKERVVTKWRDRRVVVTKPDGTRVETVETSQQDERGVEQSAELGQSRSQQNVVVSKESVAVAPRQPRRYRAGVGWGSGDRVLLSGGIRLGDLPLTLDAHAGIPYKGLTLDRAHVGLGLSVEF